MVEAYMCAESKNSRYPFDQAESRDKGERKVELCRGLIALASDRQGYSDHSQGDPFTRLSLKEERSAVTAQTIRNCLDGTTIEQNSKTTTALINLFNLDREDVIINRARPGHLKPIPVPHSYAMDQNGRANSTIVAGEKNNVSYRTEIKLCLTKADHDLSQSLILGKDPPSLYHIVQRLRMASPSSAEAKDRQLTDLSYNHFVSVSMVIYFEHPNGKGPGIWGYKRRASPESPLSNLLTQGNASLWSSAFMVHVKGEPSLMDYWLNTARHDPDTAYQDFLNRPYPWLLRLLDHKISLFGYTRLSTEPHGIITYDMRALGKNRVYTQYVFLVHISLRKFRSKDPLEHLRVHGDFGRRNGIPILLDEVNQHIFSEERDGSLVTNHMDLLAWRSCMNEKDSMSSDTSLFTRGFELI